MRVCPRGFRWLKWNRDEGLAQVFLSRWTSQRRAHRLYQCRCFCSLKSCFQDPCPDMAAHTSSSSVMRRTGKQLVQAVLFPKLPVNPEASCPLLIPANTAAGELLSSICLPGSENLSSPQGFLKLSAKLKWDFICSYAYNLRAGLMISGRSHARTSSSDGSDPKTRLNVTLPAKPLLEFQLHLTLMTVDLERCSLLPTPHSQEKVSTSLASHNGKIPPYFSMPWAPPIKAEAAFHRNPLNLTNTVAMT